MKQKMFVLLCFCIISHPMEKPSCPQFVAPPVLFQKFDKGQRQQEYSTLWDLTQSMIDQKKDLNTPIKDGQFAKKTILTAAAQHRIHKQVLELALANGADPNKRDGNSHFPLKIAISASSRTTFKFLLKKGATVKDRGLIQELCGPWHDTLDTKKALKRVNMLNALLKHGASANELDAEGNTSLYHLLWTWVPIGDQPKELNADQRNIFYGQRREMIIALLKAGINTAHQNKDGFNALDNVNLRPHLKDVQLQGCLLLEVQKNYAVKQ